MKKGFIARMLRGKELGLNLFIAVLIVACLVWQLLDVYGDSSAGLMAAVFTALLLINWVYSYYKFKP